MPLAHHHHGTLNKTLRHPVAVPSHGDPVTIMLIFLQNQFLSVLQHIIGQVYVRVGQCKVVLDGFGPVQPGLLGLR